MKAWIKDGKILIQGGKVLLCDEPPPCCKGDIKTGCCPKKIPRTLVLSITSTFGDCVGDVAIADYPLVYSDAAGQWIVLIGALIEIRVWCQVVGTEEEPGYIWVFGVKCNGTFVVGTDWVTGSPFNPTANCDPLLLQFGLGSSNLCCGDPGAGAGTFVFQVTAP